MKQQRQSDGAADRDAKDHEQLTEQSQTLGAHFGAYSRVQYFIACSSPTIRPVFGSVVSLCPVYCAMLPRWQSNTLFAPSVIGARSAAPVRIPSRKFCM